MQRTRPLSKAHPEFSVIKCPQYREYRVESRSTVSGNQQWTQIIPQACLTTVFLLCWCTWMTTPSPTQYVGVIVILILLLKRCASNIIYESLVVFPSHGIQFETHRGISSSYVLSTSRQFIPFSEYEDLFINEALFGWNVRYYIVALTQPTKGDPLLRVAFPNVLPPFPVLQAVYSDILAVLPRHRGREDPWKLDGKSNGHIR